MKLLKELVEHDENFNGLVAVNSLETYVVKLSIKLLKEMVEHDENVDGLLTQGNSRRVLPAPLTVLLTALLGKSLMN
jgi:hypothetical protein